MKMRSENVVLTPFFDIIGGGGGFFKYFDKFLTQGSPGHIIQKNLMKIICGLCFWGSLGHQ